MSFVRKYGNQRIELDCVNLEIEGKLVTSSKYQTESPRHELYHITFVTGHEWFKNFYMQKFYNDLYADQPAFSKPILTEIAVNSLTLVNIEDTSPLMQYLEELELPENCDLYQSATRNMLAILFYGSDCLVMFYLELPEEQCYDKFFQELGNSVRFES